MGADKLGGGYGSGVVLAYGDPKLLLLALGHQPGLMDPFGRYILQLWDPSLHVLTLQIIVLQTPNQTELYNAVTFSRFCRLGTWWKVCAGKAVWPVLARECFIVRPCNCISSSDVRSIQESRGCVSKQDLPNDRTGAYPFAPDIVKLHKSIVNDSDSTLVRNKHWRATITMQNFWCK